MTPEQIQKVKKLRLAIFDVDGVLTNGQLYYGPDGEMLKVFHVHDGHGLKQLMQHGIEVAIISGRDCAALRTRLAELKIKHVFLGQKNKIPALNSLLENLDLSSEEACYTGDDLPDLEPMQHVGFSFAPANAVAEIRYYADWVCKSSGGEGAVREICSLILATQKKQSNV